MEIRQYTEHDLEALLSSWESANRLADPFMTDGFIAQEKINVAELYLPNTDTWVVEVEGEVKGFIALMDKAKALHDDLEVEVFKENLIGRQFYAKYGFELLEEKFHEPTGQKLLRLKFTTNKFTQ